MAQSLLQKIGVLVSASLHGLLDQALQKNSLAVFDEYIRQAENSMEMLTSALADTKVSVNMLKRRYDESANDAAEIDLQIDAALKVGKNSIAQAQQTKFNRLLEIARTYQTQYEKERRQYQLLLEMAQVLQAKVDVLSSQREQVKTLLDLLKSKQIVAKSIKDIQKISDTKTVEILEDVKTQLDQTDAQLEVATTRLSDQINDEVDDAGLEAQLDERRKRLGLS